MIGKVLYPVFPFNMVYSTDIGIIKYLQHIAETTDSGRTLVNRISNATMLSELKDANILVLTQTRTDPNPLSVLPLVKGDIDFVYESLMTLNKKEIVELSPFTDLGYALITFASKQFDGIEPYIWVKDDYEKERIESTPDLSGAHIMTEDLFFSSKIPFDPYYVDYISDLKKIDDLMNHKIVGKNIYMSDAVYNDDVLSLDLPIIKNNIFTSIEVWRKDRLQP